MIEADRFLEDLSELEFEGLVQRFEYTFELAIGKIGDFGIFSYHSNAPNVGFSLNSDKDQYKMFVGDTGLFITLAFWDKDVTENIIYQKLLSDKLSANLSYVYENIVAQMLTATGNKLFYHTWPMENSNHN